MTTDIETLVSEAIGLLKSLIAIPSLSREEEQAADFLQNYIEMQGMATGRKGNNIWCLSPMFDLNKPTLLLNSHIDTVKPVNGWRKAPFNAVEENGKISVLPKSTARPATPGDIGNIMHQNAVAEESPFVTLIADGHILYENLRLSGRDEKWLERKLSEQGIGSVNDVFFAAADTSGTFLAFRREKKKGEGNDIFQ